MVYVSYGPNTLDLDHDLEALLYIPPPPSDDVMDLWVQQLTHHDFSTNSLQYEMLLEVINNLLLHVEPHRRGQRAIAEIALSTATVQHRGPAATGAANSKSAPIIHLSTETPGDRYFHVPKGLG